MARFPLAGKTKTRLAADVGQDMAKQVYSQCARLVFQEICKLPQSIKKYVFVTGSNSTKDVTAWTGPDFILKYQVGDNLGQRLQRAFDDLFLSGSERAVLLASDVPDMTADLVTEALTSLMSHDIVLGPSHDGGYYLIGMGTQHNELFRGVAWGSSKVLSQTVASIKKLGLTLHLLPQLIDIDNLSNYELWKMSHTETVIARAGFTVKHD